MSRRKFTASFKLNAIKLGEEKENVAQAARELGVKASLIHRWKREQQEFSHISFRSGIGISVFEMKTLGGSYIIQNRPVL